MTRILRWLLWLPLLLLAFGAWLVATESGLDWAWQWAGPYLPDTVAIADVDGRLIGPLEVTGLRVPGDGSGLVVDQVTLDWQPARLLSGELRVGPIRLQGLRFTAAEDEQEQPAQAPTLALPELPVTVVVADVVLRDLAYRSGSEAEPVTLAELRLGQLRLDGAGLDLDGLGVRDPKLRLDAAGRLARGSNGAVTLQVDWQAKPPDRPPMAGHGKLGGTRQSLTLQHRIAPPYALRLQAQVENALTAPAVSAKIDATEAGTTAWLGTRPQGVPETLGLTLDLAGTWQDGALAIERAQLRQRDSGARVQATGRIEPGGPKADLDLQWHDLRWPLQGEPEVVSPSGEIRLTGGPDNWRGQLHSTLAPSGIVDADLRLRGEQVEGHVSWQHLRLADLVIPQGELRVEGGLDGYRVRADTGAHHPQFGEVRALLSGQGDRETLQVENLKLAVMGGTVTGGAHVTWTPAVRFEVDLNGRGLDPVALWEAWPGRLDVALSASGGIDPKTGLQVQVPRLTVDGRLREQPFHAAAAGGWRDSVLRLREFNLRSGQTKLQAQGEAGEQWDLAWSIDSPDLSQLAPQLEGRLQGDGWLRGELPELRAAAELDGKNLRYETWTTDKLALNAQVDLSGRQASQIALDAERVSLAGDYWTIHLTGNGRPEQHRLRLQANAGERELALTVAGDWQRPDWRGQLLSAQLAPGIGPTWRLVDAVPLSYTGGVFRLDRGCWSAKDARACVAVGAAPGRTDGEYRIDGLPLSLAAAVLPPDVRIDGQLSAIGGFGYTADGLRLSMDFETTSVSLSAADDDSEVFGLDPGGGRLRLTPEGGHLETAYQLRPGGHLRVDLTLGAGALLQARTLTGTANLALPDLAPLAVVHPEVQSLGGRLDGELRFGGRVAAPTIAGELTLADGIAVLPRPGLHLSAIGLRLSGDGQALALSGSARSGDGHLALKGKIDPVASAVDMTIVGERFQVFNTPDARVAVSPDLSLALSGRRVDVTGEVHVPSARITPRDISDSGGIPVSRDQVLVHGEQAEPPLQVNARVRLVLGEDVQVAAFGLKGDLGGEITVRQAPGQLVTATGDLEIINGEYRAYGQGLQIETGRLLFTGGPVAAPGLDVRAQRRPAENVTVGVIARGTLQEPEFRLFSEPAMSQTEQLSWLVLGRPVSEASGGESSALAGAAIGLGLRGGDNIAGRIKDSLGLDVLGVESEAGGPRDQAAFVIGKYLSPKLYVSYGIGLFEPVNVLKMRYEITQNWKLITESGTQVGGDLIYTIER